MPSLSSSDYQSIVMVATFLASFQSPLSALLAEIKDSKSYLWIELFSFASLVSAATLAILEHPLSFVLLILGILLAMLTYVSVVVEENGVSLFADA
ncbi:MAG: hypothetical protein OK454_06375 [Thaumarchaeota archaeon]|nr:hypothetical protein [Nitrososphaerota archaeon]